MGLALLERSEVEQPRYAERIDIWPTAPLSCALHFAVLTQRQHDPLVRALQTAVAHVWQIPAAPRLHALPP